MSRRDLGLAAIFRWPIILAVLSVIGLVGALLADDLWDPIGAILLGFCLVPAVWFRWRARRPGPRTPR